MFLRNLPYFCKSRKLAKLLLADKHYGDLEFREVSEAELIQLFGSYELADLLDADKLERIFTEVTFIEETT